MKRSLRTHLSLSILFVLLFTIALISLLANNLISAQFRDYVARQQQIKAQEIVTTLSLQYDSEAKTWNSSFIHMFGMYVLADGYIVKVYDNNGNSIWDAENHDMALCAQVMTDISDRMFSMLPAIIGKFTPTEYSLTQDERKIGTVLINYFGPYFLSESDFQFLDALNKILFFTGTLSLFLALVVSYVLSRRISNPVIKTATIAKQIAAGDYKIALKQTTGINELDELTASVNHLAISLAEQEHFRKQITADVAHELRTPLTTLNTHLEAMTEGISEPTVQRLQSCREEIERLIKLVADLESLAKVESAGFRLQKATLDLYETAQTVVERFSLEASRKELTLILKGTPSRVFADRDRINQVIFNLLSNAVKYTPEKGHISVIVENTAEESSLSIADDGEGIAPEELSHIFERFYRADKSRNRKTGGAGVGLTIVKSIVEAHGGQVEVTSQPGAGSCFKVIFPKQ